MSADNGIYILKTQGYCSIHDGYDEHSSEFRIAHLQAVENVNWDHDGNDYTDDPDVMIHNARQMKSM